MLEENKLKQTLSLIALAIAQPSTPNIHPGELPEQNVTTVT